MDKNYFQTEFNISDADLLKAGISWDELQLIAEEYQKIETKLRDISKSFIDEY